MKRTYSEPTAKLPHTHPEWENLISPRFLDFRRRRGVNIIPASRNLEILGKSIIIDVIVISPRFLDFRRRRGVNITPASRNLEILGKSILEESVLF